VIEVSDSSLNYDRTVKLPIYADSGIPVYFIVNLKERVVEAYSDLVGHAGALVRHPNGVISGATDPRSDGAVAGF